MSPNKHMQRARRHEVLGRGQASLVPCSAPRALIWAVRRHYVGDALRDPGVVGSLLGDAVWQ